MEAGGANEAPPRPAAAPLGHGPPFAGIATFNRAEYTHELEGAELAVLGVPFDVGAVNRPGARYGPQAIRQQSLYAGLLQPVYPWDEELAQAFRVIDHGDVAVAPGTGAVEAMIEQTEAVAARVFAAGASLLTLGGDHTLPYGPVRAAAKAFGPLALIHLDAHQDSLDSDASSGGRMINHGTFATGLPKEGHIDGARSAQVYIRTFMDNPAGYAIHYADDAVRLGPEELAVQVRTRVGDGPVYVSIDMDAIDPSSAPGAGSPVPGGPSGGEVRRFLKALDGLDIVAADVVELNPAYDPGQVSAVLAAFMSFDLLHLMGNARRRRVAGS